jgi:sulfoxide reductase heme-binding subunit YedZ
MTNNWLWFIARGAGLSAVLALTIATALGSLGSIRMRAVSWRVVMQYLHRTAAVLGLLLIVVHVSAILLDSLAHVGLDGAFIPFASSYRHTAVALGTFTLYALVIITALGLARGRLTTSRFGIATWRIVHCLTYVCWATAVTHGLLAGTDRGQRWVQALDAVCIAAVVLAVTVRLGLLRSDAVGRPRPQRQSTMAGR